MVDAWATLQCWGRDEPRWLPVLRADCRAAFMDLGDMDLERQGSLECLSPRYLVVPPATGPTEARRLDRRIRHLARLIRRDRAGGDLPPVTLEAAGRAWDL